MNDQEYNQRPDQDQPTWVSEPSASTDYQTNDLDLPADEYAEYVEDAISSDSPMPPPKLMITAKRGQVYCGDSFQFLQNGDVVTPGSVNLIVTSPPFGLVRKKEYGNVDADEYVDWFRPFAQAFFNVLADNGSLVIDIGGAWIPGQPTRSLYHYELLVMLCREYKFHLAQEFYWWNPSKLPTPAEWVTVRRIRVKDAVNCVWWLSKTPWPKASNVRVLQPYSESMLELLKNGYKAKLRPSGHDISTKFSVDNGAAIPPNILAIPNTESNSVYLRYCTEHDLKTHPARFPAALPEYFIRMLTDPDDLVIDPFAGSCVTGEVSERLNRQWICVELREDYVEGARGRFVSDEKPSLSNGNTEKFYKLARPGLLWNGYIDDPLPPDGGKVRSSKPPKLADGNLPAGRMTLSENAENDKDVAESRVNEKLQDSLW